MKVLNNYKNVMLNEPLLAAIAVQNGFFIALSTLSEMAGNGSEIAAGFLTAAGMPIGETINPPGWMMALSLVQVIINLVLTVYVFLFAQWDNS